MKGSIHIDSALKGMGEFFRNSYPACGCVSDRTTFWEDGSVEQDEYVTCTRICEVVDPEELFARATR